MTREQLITRFTRHPSPDAQQDKSGSGHAAIAEGAAAFALTLFERVPGGPHTETAMRDALAHVEAAVEIAVETLTGHVAAPVAAAPTFAEAVEPVAPAVEPVHDAADDTPAPEEV